MSKKTERKPRRLRRALAVLLVGLLLLVAAAPTLVMNSPLLASVLADAIPPEAGTLTAQRGAGGWMTPIALHGVEVRDARGELILQAEALALSHALPGLISGNEPLKLVVQRPIVHLTVRPDGANVQDFLQAVDAHAAADDPAAPAGAGRSKPDVRAISARNATVYVTDAATGARYTHQQLSADIDLTGGVTALAVSGRLGDAQGDFAPLAAEQAPPNFRVDLDPIQGDARRVLLRLDDAPVGAMDPLLRRIDPTLRLDGLATGGGEFSWRAPQAPAVDWVDQLLASGLSSTGMITLQGFTAQARTLGSETLRLANVEAPWKLRTDNAGLTLEDLRVSTDVGSARVRAVLQADDLRRLAARQLDAASGVLPVGRVGLELDVARLAQLAPGLVSLRSDVRPIAGRLVAQLETEQHQGTRLTGGLTASNFQAEVAGTPIAWEAPFALSGEVSRGAGGLVLHNLACQSPFLNGSLQGDLTNLRGNLSFDLDKLASELGRFVDLRQWRLTGRGDSEVRTEELSPGRRRATLVANLTEVTIAHAGAVYLREPELTASLSGEVTLDPATGGVASLDAGRLAVQSGDDNLMGVLTQPVAWQAGAAPQLRASLSGSLASWQDRAQIAVTPIGGLEVLSRYETSGQIELEGDARVGAGMVQLTGLDATATDLRITGGALAVREAKAELSGDFVWDAERGLLESRAGEFVTSTISLRTQDVRAQVTPGAANASGRVALLADLAQLNRWFAASDRPLPSGQLEGVLTLSQSGGKLSAQVDATGRQIVFADAATRRPLLKEPNLRLVASAGYLSETQQLVIESATLTSDTLRIQATGDTDGGATRLAGTIDYDLTALAPVIAGYVGPEVQLTGRHQAQFNVSRAASQTPRHWSQAWQGRVQAPWTSINLFGLPIGPGQAGVTLAAGEAKLDPLQLAVSGGQLSTQLSARLDPPPAVWGVVPGPLLTDVQVTPEISERMLKYIAPVLAGATRSQGVFSLQLQSAGGPLNPLAQLGAQGSLQARQVLVTPGPTTVQWVRLAKQVEALVRNGDPTALLGGAASDVPLLAINDRTVEFQIDQGRVFHQGLQFEIGDVSVTSGGSVGFDETLDIVLTVPIKDTWIAGRPLLAGLRGQVVQLPIRGTFKRPEVDPRALQNLSKSLVRDGVRGAIGGALQRLLGE